MYCFNCGKEINNEFNYCPHCGKNLKERLPESLIQKENEFYYAPYSTPFNEPPREQPPVNVVVQNQTPKTIRIKQGHSCLTTILIVLAVITIPIIIVASCV